MFLSPKKDFCVRRHQSIIIYFDVFRSILSDAETFTLTVRKLRNSFKGRTKPVINCFSDQVTVKNSITRQPNILAKFALVL